MVCLWWSAWKKRSSFFPDFLGRLEQKSRRCIQQRRLCFSLESAHQAFKLGHYIFGDLAVLFLCTAPYANASGNLPLHKERSALCYERDAGVVGLNGHEGCASVPVRAWTSFCRADSVEGNGVSPFSRVFSVYLKRARVSTRKRRKAASNYLLTNGEFQEETVSGILQGKVGTKLFQMFVSSLSRCVPEKRVTPQHPLGKVTCRYQGQSSRKTEGRNSA